MFYVESIQRILKYILLGTIALSPQCFAAVETELNDKDHEEYSLKSSRGLLYSWDDDYRKKTYRSSGTEEAIYIVLAIVVFIIYILCKCCIKFGCDEETNGSSNAVVHPPPTASRNRPSTTVPPSSGRNVFTTSRTRASTGRNVLAPPRTSSSIILPPDAQPFSINVAEIESFNYSSTVNQLPTVTNYSEPRRRADSSTNLLDLPPSYESIMAGQIPSGQLNAGFSKEYECPPPKY